MTPQQMLDKPELEKEYVFALQSKMIRKPKPDDFELPIGTMVRYQLPRGGIYSRKRYRYSKESYRIDSKNGRLYNISAQDGTSLTIPRFRLIKAEHTHQARTTGNANTGIMEKIVGYVPSTHMYKVQFRMDDGNLETHNVTKRNVRGNMPNIKSPLELEWFASHPKKK
jgi:hypothetical protein